MSVGIAARDQEWSRAGNRDWAVDEITFAVDQSSRSAGKAERTRTLFCNLQQSPLNRSSDRR